MDQLKLVEETKESSGRQDVGGSARSLSWPQRWNGRSLLVCVAVHHDRAHVRVVACSFPTSAHRCDSNGGAGETFFHYPQLAC